MQGSLPNVRTSSCNILASFNMMSDITTAFLSEKMEKHYNSPLRVSVSSFIKFVIQKLKAKYYEARTEGF